MNQRLLIINSKEYELDRAISIGKSGPVIEAKEDEINFNYVVKIHPEAEITDLDNDTLILYRLEGKYIIIAGKSTAESQRNDKKFRGFYTAKLISSPMLKRAKVGSYEEVPVLERVMENQERKSRSREYSR